MGKKQVKKQIKKATKKTSQASKKTSISKVISGGISAVQKFLPGRTSASQARAYMARMGKRKSAKALLKRAYEKRALREIKRGDLGHARKTLRKKITVV